DSKKSGSTTISHLRFGKKPIRSSYLIQSANFVGCHQFVLLDKFDVLEKIVDGGTFLLNTIYGKDEVWDKLPKKIQKTIIDKKLNFYAINAYDVAEKTGMGERINTVMQTCFFAISGVLPKNEAIEQIKKAIKKTYGAKGDAVVQKNYEAVDQTLENLFKVEYPNKVTSTIEQPPIVSDEAPDFVKNVLAKMMVGKGDSVSVKELPIDGTFPSATTQWEKRNIALHVPSWDPELCIQCGKCSMVCPHAVIRMKIYDKKHTEGAPSTFKFAKAIGKDFGEDAVCTIQVSVSDCTGCTLCYQVCPAKSKEVEGKKALTMVPQVPLRVTENENHKFFMNIPDSDRTQVKINTIKGLSLLRPLFEYSGACGGCGETPYVKLVSQLFGDRAVVANATGCSSIYGGNLPTTPWAKNNDGRGPAWNNSLFEDNAEFGFGMRLAIDKNNQIAKELIKKLADQIGNELLEKLLNTDQSTEAGINNQRINVEELKGKLKEIKSTEAKSLLNVANFLVRRSVWIIGGDGWAYDIGYGGLDHVIASGKNINILVLDTEVYSNTGGQMSKATGMGAVARFAEGGKRTPKKDLAMLAMTYQNVYVARVAFGANDLQTLKAFIEAEAYDGPSIIIAYSHCINHGIDMATGLDSQKFAVETGYWPLIRFNPDKIKEGKNPLQLDSKAPSRKLEEYIYRETRYKSLTKSKPEIAAQLLIEAQEDVLRRWKIYEQMAKFDYSLPSKENESEQQENAQQTENVQ
ncbi:MAG: pyruvate:ferredoxin (flavodoxin) oxidoreductase, partial [Ignavibacteriales bacterium]|nr:pyruvate:ferredoxin (flavodoxin) oxidoreductase [Ignavibacteriales bacterium]